MTIDTLLRVLSILITAALALLRERMTAKPRLVCYNSHTAALVSPAGHIYGIHNLVVRNIGKKQANNVRVGHIVTPQSHKPDGSILTNYVYNVWPTISFREETSPKGAYDLLFPVLAPKQQITLSYGYEAPTTASNITGLVRCDEQIAVAIDAMPAPHPPRVLVWYLLASAALGTATLIYALLRAGVYLIHPGLIPS